MNEEKESERAGVRGIPAYSSDLDLIGAGTSGHELHGINVSEIFVREVQWLVLIDKGESKHKKSIKNKKIHKWKKRRIKEVRYTVG